MGSLTADDIRSFLIKLGERFPHAATIYMLGGSAMCLLGSARPTVDIDYATESSGSDERLRDTIASLAVEMGLEIEPVQLDEFIPLPERAEERHRHLATYGQLQVYVFDLYSNALSKVARGFESDLEDVMFLLRRNLIDLKQLERYVKRAMPRSTEFDVDPKEFQRNWSALRSLMRR